MNDEWYSESKASLNVFLPLFALSSHWHRIRIHIGIARIVFLPLFALSSHWQRIRIHIGIARIVFLTCLSPIVHITD